MQLLGSIQHSVLPLEKQNNQGCWWLLGGTISKSRLLAIGKILCASTKIIQVAEKIVTPRLICTFKPSCTPICVDEKTLFSCVLRLSVITVSAAIVTELPCTSSMTQTVERVVLGLTHCITYKPCTGNWKDSVCRQTTRRVINQERFGLRRAWKFLAHTRDRQHRVLTPDVRRSAKIIRAWNDSLWC